MRGLLLLFMNLLTPLHRRVTVTALGRDDPCPQNYLKRLGIRGMREL